MTRRCVDIRTPSSAAKPLRVCGAYSFARPTRGLPFSLGLNELGNDKTVNPLGPGVKRNSYTVKGLGQAVLLRLSRIGRINRPLRFADPGPGRLSGHRAGWPSPS